MSARACGFGVLLAMACVLSAGAIRAEAATSRLHLLSRSAVLAVTDGSRYVLWRNQEDGPLHALDTRLGKRRSFTLPAGCAAYPDPESYSPAGKAVIPCEGAGPDRLLDLRTGSSRPLPLDVQDATGTTFRVGWDRVGRQWALGFADGLPVYFNWHSGKMRQTEYEPFERVLDSADLTRRCSTYRHDPHAQLDYYDSRRYLQFDAGLWVRGCDGHRRLLSRNKIEGWQLGSALAGWQRVDRPTVEAVNVRSGRRYSWRVPGAQLKRFDPSHGIFVTRDRVVVTRTLRQSCSSDCVTDAVRVYLARIPT